MLALPRNTSARRTAYFVPYSTPSPSYHTQPISLTRAMHCSTVHTNPPCLTQVALPFTHAPDDVQQLVLARKARQRDAACTRSWRRGFGRIRGLPADRRKLDDGLGPSAFAFAFAFASRIIGLSGHVRLDSRLGVSRCTMRQDL